MAVDGLPKKRYALAGSIAALTISAAFASEARTEIGGSCPARPTAYAGAGTLKGNIDGDGVDDHVSIVWARKANGCRWRMAVRSARRTYLAPLTQPNADTYWSTDRLPTLWRLAEIDDRKGSEMLVALDTGASTTAYGIFAIRRGALMRLRVRPSGEFPDAFVTGSSLAGAFGFGCAAPSEMVQTSYGQQRDRFLGNRVFYRLRGNTFYFLRRRGFNLSLAQLRRLPELRQQPFARCSH